jgi:2-polyprenyl-6-methoxyphenol hydroxylase-like FAD-dependent oxidoreductase
LPQRDGSHFWLSTCKLVGRATDVKPKKRERLLPSLSRWRPMQMMAKMQRRERRQEPVRRSSHQRRWSRKIVLIIHLF